MYDFEYVPLYLRNKAQWVVWGKRSVHYQNELDEDNKLNKLPYNPRTGGGAMSNNPQTWGTFDAVLKLYQDGWYNGIGFMFSELDGLVGIDLDHCLDLDSQIPDKKTEEIIAHFSDTYMEISPSGDGLHIFCFGLAHHCGKGQREKWIEMYGKDITGCLSYRYFCVTGKRFSEASEIVGKQKELTWLHETFKKVEEVKPVNAAPIRITENSTNRFEKYVNAAINAELAKVQHAAIGDRNDTLYRAAITLKELCNSTWSAPFISSANIESLLLSATSLKDKEAKSTINSAFKKAGTRELPANEFISNHPPKFEHHSKLGKPTLIWEYIQDSYYIYEWDTHNGKETRPVSWNPETSKWQWKDPKGKLPLYNIGDIKAYPNAQIIFCEGEKAADAAKRFFSDAVTTTTARGSKSPGRTNFKPLIGRDIIIWPSNGKSGCQYADELIELLLINGEVAKVEILIVPDDFPKKGDAANAPDDLDISMWELVDQTHMREVFNRPQSVSTNIEVTESEESEVDSNWVGKLKTNAYGCVTNTKTNIR
ncbi:MAG: hypothetical protein VSS75_014050, partial [Candidatus Parabeggiatoa sp.]|nr:hypothetical protein [Candidatus Parabeggiatoa sp.]